jgi:hypothetical protein
MIPIKEDIKITPKKDNTSYASAIKIACDGKQCMRSCASCMDFWSSLLSGPCCNCISDPNKPNWTPWTLDNKNELREGTENCIE